MKHLHHNGCQKLCFLYATVLGPNCHPFHSIQSSVDRNLLPLACTATVVIAKSSGLAADLVIPRELL